jgi:hypothetical protein
MSVDAALLGTVVRDAELRTSAAGKPWMSVIARSGDGDSAAASGHVAGIAKESGGVEWSFGRKRGLEI